MLDWLQTPDLGLVIYGVIDLVDGKSQQNEVLFRLEGSERTW